MVRASAILLLTGFVVAAAAQPEFEVATVKQSRPASGDLIRIDAGTVRGGRVTLTNATLSDCLKFAYGVVSDDQILGPEWIRGKAVRFDIVGQAPAGTSREQMPRMLQSLLADRLKLTLHHELKERRYLALMVGKNGARIAAADVDRPGSSGDITVGGRIVGSRISMAALASLLSRFERQTVVNDTGLEGLFSVKLEWAPGEPEAANDGLSVYTALQEQLGLRLESRRGPLDVLVIDSADKIPGEN